MSDQSSSDSDEEVVKRETRKRKERGVTRYQMFEESLADSDEDLVKRGGKKRRISSDDDDDWIPEEPTKEPKTAPKRTKKIGNAAAVKKEPKPKVQKEPKVRVKKEPKARVVKEPKIKVKKEPKIRVKKELQTNIKQEFNHEIKMEPGIKTEVGSDTENAMDVKSESKLNIYKDDAHEERSYEAPGSAWETSELLSEMLMLDPPLARNIVRLFESDNTIPFIARYRKELTGNMDAETLRNVKDTFETIKAIQAKQVTILKSLDKSGHLDPILEQCVLGARSFSELEHIYAPYKVGSKRTKAEAARNIGLEPPALALLYGREYVQLEPFLNYEIDGLSIISDIENGVCHIIADIISKDKDVLDNLRQLQKKTRMRIETTKSRSATTSDKSKIKNEDGKDKKKGNNKSDHNKDDLEGKYQHYFQFNSAIAFIKPHQVLAINRGENQKILSVKVIIPDWLMHNLQNFCRNHFLNSGLRYPLRTTIFEKSFKDAYTRLIQPLVVRSVRAELNKSAERASIEVFATNLKKLLLTPPLRGKVVMGIDPGFHHGCKVAVTAQNGAILDTAVLHINFANYVNVKNDRNASILKSMLMRHNCDTIGLGNGTACRQTETYLSQLIKMNWFAPLDVKFTIVSESGASIYSCSPEAAKEFPGMDPNLISAVSLARRLQDPLGELVKVEPKHLGVGMYQHDVSEKHLSSTLDEVVSECVSFVGVDLNTASHSILRRVAGLNAARSSKIIDWRECNGPFTNRQQLRLVKGIGDKSFEQCAGFVRILPQSTFKSTGTDQSSKPKSSSTLKKQKTAVKTEINPLDQTWIHPEMYTVADRFVVKCRVQLNDLGTIDFIRKVNDAVMNIGISNLAIDLGISEAQVAFINEGLTQLPDYDIRSAFSTPLFRKSFASIDELQVGNILTGRVENVTHFGSFVDIGVGKSGLLPTGKLTNSIVPQLGDRVEVKVIAIELQRKRITLALLKLL